MQEVSAETGAAEKMERWPLFDVMRVAAASAVVVSHGFALTGRQTPILFSTPGRDYSLGGLSVGVFFVLSGWLITASWGRNRPSVFALRRFARIMPGLVVATFFAVFVVGPLFTSSAGYFQSPQTWDHLLNNALMRPLSERGLPGVFETNPVGGIVNGSLWTLPHEAISYVAVALLGAAGLLRRGWAIALAIVSVVAVQAGLSHDLIGWTGLLWSDLAALGAWFLLGSALYLCRTSVQWNRASAIAALTLALLANGTALVLPLIAYLVLYVGTQPVNLRLPRWAGDPSYGIYVYAFPVQQAVAHLAPGLSVAGHVAVTLPIIVALGVASWWLIESPIMRAVRSRQELSLRGPVAERPAGGRGDCPPGVVVDPKAVRPDLIAM